MSAFLLRRLLAAVPVLWGVATAVFLLVEVAPGRPFHLEAGAGVDPAASQRLREVFGAEDPLAVRYGRWLARAAAGDLGRSYTHRRPVAAVMAEGLGNTVLLAGLALALQFAAGTTLGLLAAGAGRWTSRALGAGAALLYALPSFWIGLVLTGLLAVRLGWLPASQMRSLGSEELTAWSRLLDVAGPLVLPALSLALPAVGGIALYVRDELRAVLARPFIRAARGRGLRRRAVMARHALANALLPVAHLLGLALPGLVGGSVVIEVLFAWPGMGRLAYQAVLSRDEPLILGCTLVAAAMVVAGSLAADLLSAVLDPRFREEVT